MTFADRVTSVAGMGFTERQAGFLVYVMLHSGVCLGRQYCAYARIVRGQKMVDFFKKLVDNRLATPYSCGHNKAHVYHVHSIKLYAAIGERHARFRKRTALARTIERLMLLDHIIAHREMTWLGAEQDKLAHFLTMSRDRDQLPRLSFGNGADVTVRFFPDKLPIGVSADTRSHVFLYLLTDPLPHDFRAFLRRHAELLRSLPTWTVRLLVPRSRHGEIQLYRRAFQEELAMPLNGKVGDELRWFFRHGDTGIPAEQERFRRARRAFGAPRFRALRRAWLLGGNRAIDVAMSSSLAESIARGDGRLECQELSRQYLHFTPLVGTA